MKPRTTFALAVVTLAAAGCGLEPEPTVDHQAPLRTSFAVSECGGFGEVLPGEGGEGYCEAERLEWSHDAASSVLELRNRRVILNCCGERSVTAAIVDGVLEIVETDEPEGGEGGRCWCTCVFDFVVTVAPVEGYGLPVRLTREVTDAAGAVTIWAGTIDLTAGFGEVVTDAEDAGGFCGATY